MKAPAGPQSREASRRARCPTTTASLTFHRSRHPPLALRDSLGHSVNLNQFRGKAVLVTFIYDHCPDICPLMVGNLHTAQSQLGPEAQKLQIIAVSVDPRGDTPRTVRAFLREHRMTGRMEYLLGSRPRLEKVWRAWNILAKPSPERASPDKIEHSELIYGISASGKITTFYSHDFLPEHDRPRCPDIGLGVGVVPPWSPGALVPVGSIRAPCVDCPGGVYPRIQESTPRGPRGRGQAQARWIRRVTAFHPERLAASFKGLRVTTRQLGRFSCRPLLPELSHGPPRQARRAGPARRQGRRHPRPSSTSLIRP